ncbi:MAG: hypothetical protein M5U09_10365 [Gammaproteobacteria bacterium]|nr:hypothetical protein [Gammaproteobacteria bacterium]
MVERFRGSPYHERLEKLAAWNHQVAEGRLEETLLQTAHSVRRSLIDSAIDRLLEKIRPRDPERGRQGGPDPLHEPEADAAHGRRAAGGVELIPAFLPLKFHLSTRYISVFAFSQAHYPYTRSAWIQKRNSPS